MPCFVQASFHTPPLIPIIHQHQNQPASAFVLLGLPARHQKPVVGRHTPWVMPSASTSTPTAAAAAVAQDVSGPWGLGRLLNRFRRHRRQQQPAQGPPGGGTTTTLTWTIELDADVAGGDNNDGNGGAMIQVSPLFGVDRFDFRLVAAASTQGPDPPALGLYLEHFPPSSSPAAAAVPSVQCRLRWSRASSSSTAYGENTMMPFDHTFDDPLSSSMLAGKAGLIPLSGGVGGGDDDAVRVEATVTLLGVHFPSPTERAAMESAAWDELVRQMEEMGENDDDGEEEGQGATPPAEVEAVRLFGRQ